MADLLKHNHLKLTKKAQIDLQLQFGLIKRMEEGPREAIRVTVVEKQIRGTMAYPRLSIRSKWTKPSRYYIEKCNRWI